MIKPTDKDLPPWLIDLNPNNIDDINTLIAGCGVYIGNLPSRLIPVFKEWFPDATIDWNVGCTEYTINGVRYGQHPKFYWTNNAPKFYVKR